MVYAKIDDNIVIGISVEEQPDWQEVPDNIVSGMIQNQDGTFSNPPKRFEVEIARLRLNRKHRLLETDWMGNSDVNMSSEWKTYRQSLRDITNGLTTVADIEAVTWPEKPE